MGHRWKREGRRPRDDHLYAVSASGRYKFRTRACLYDAERVACSFGLVDYPLAHESGFRRSVTTFEGAARIRRRNQLARDVLAVQTFLRHMKVAAMDLSRIGAHVPKPSYF